MCENELIDESCFMNALWCVSCQSKRRLNPRAGCCTQSTNTKKTGNFDGIFASGGSKFLLRDLLYLANMLFGRGETGGSANADRRGIAPDERLWTTIRSDMVLPVCRSHDQLVNSRT